MSLSRNVDAFTSYTEERKILGDLRTLLTVPFPVKFFQPETNGDLKIQVKNREELKGVDAVMLASHVCENIAMPLIDTSIRKMDVLAQNGIAQAVMRAREEVKDVEGSSVKMDAHLIRAASKSDPVLRESNARVIGYILSGDVSRELKNNLQLENKVDDVLGPTCSSKGAHEFAHLVMDTIAGHVENLCAALGKSPDTETALKQVQAWAQSVENGNRDHFDPARNYVVEPVAAPAEPARPLTNRATAASVSAHAQVPA